MVFDMSNIQYHIGVIVPSSNTTMELELCRFLQYGLVFHFARVPLREVTPEALDEMKKDAIKAARLLADLKPVVIGYGCMSVKEDDDLAIAIENEVNIPTITVAQAVFDAFKHLNIKKMIYISPTTEEVDLYERQFIERQGFKITKNKNMNILDNREIGEVSPETVKEFALSIKAEGADGFFISCTNLQAIDIIDTLEKETNLPVVTANQAFVWGVIKKGKIPIKKIKGLGRLFII